MFRRTTCRNMSVAVFGSSTLNYFTGPLILLLKTHPIVTKLVQVCESLRCDLMQTATHCQMLSEVEGHLKNVDIIVVAPAQPADVPIIVSQFSNSLRESMQSRNNTKVPPIILVTSPTSSINTLTPLVHKYLLLQGIAIPKHCVMGSVTLHTMRSRVALSTYLGKNPFDIDVSVIGGATPTTCVPQFAAFEHHFGFSRSMSEQLTYATTLVTNSETNGMGYAEAYANGELIVSILRGLRGDPSVSECVYTENILQEGEDKLFRSLSKQPDESENEKSDYCPEFFTRRVVFGERGIEEFLPLGKLSDLETKLLGESLETLKKDIQYAKCFEPEAICK